MDRDLESTTLPDEPLAGPITDFADDDIDVSFVGDDDASFALEPKGKSENVEARRGQNEADEPQGEADADLDGADPDLADIKDAAARERIMAARREAASKTREFLKHEEQWQRQLLTSELRNAAIQRDSAKMALDGIDLRIRTATEAMKAAAIDEDKAAVIDLEAQIRELHKVRGDIQEMTAKIPRDDDLKGRFEQYRAKRAAEVMRDTRADDGIQPQSQLAKTWAASNTWMNNPKYAIETSAVVAMSNALASEGYDINSQAHFVELSKRMAKKFPTLAVKDNHGRALNGGGQKPQNTSPPVGSARTPQVQQTRLNGKVKNTVQLDGTDRRMMRVLGMDPADKKAAQRYAKEKLNRLRSEQRA